MNITKKHKGLIYLWLATLILAASSSVIERLGTAGAQHLIHDRNPISFCNVLFASNLIGGFIFLILYYKSLHFHAIKKIQLKQWSMLSMIALSATILGPIFYFLSVMLTYVINVILVSTTEIAWTLILGFLFFKEKPSGLNLVGTLFATIGVGVTFLLYQPEINSPDMRLIMINVGTGWVGHFLTSLPKSGEICAALGAFFTVLGDQLAKRYVRKEAIGFLNVYRTFIGAIIFFLIAVSLFGMGHFADLFSPFLWKWMVFYGAIIIALQIYTWARSLQTADTNELAIASAVFPIAGIMFAFLIVGEIPDKAQIIGGIVILGGIAIGLYDNLKIKETNK